MLPLKGLCRFPILLSKEDIRGSWVAQSVKRPTLGFNSGHDLTDPEFKPCIRRHAGTVQPAWDSNSLSIPFLLCSCIALSQNKERKEKKRKEKKRKEKKRKEKKRKEKRKERKENGLGL